MNMLKREDCWSWSEWKHGTNGDNTRERVFIFYYLVHMKTHALSFICFVCSNFQIRTWAWWECVCMSETCLTRNQNCRTFELCAVQSNMYCVAFSSLRNIVLCCVKRFPMWSEERLLAKIEIQLSTEAEEGVGKICIPTYRPPFAHWSSSGNLWKPWKKPTRAAITRTSGV